MTAQDDFPVRRNWERLEYRTDMVLVLDDGRTIEGKTADVSLGGVFLQTTDPVTDIKMGDRGELRLAPDDVESVFPCQVVRVAEYGLGLNFQGHQATFGMFVTHGMMLDLLTSINNAFASSLDLQTTLMTSVSHIKNYLQCEAASLFLIDEESDEIVCRSCSGPVDITGTRLKRGEGVVGRTIAEDATMIIHDVRDESIFSNKVDEATGFRTESLLCAPLRVQDKVIGALEVINKRGSGFFAGHDRVVLTALASATAMAINNAWQSEELLNKEMAEKANEAKSDFLSSMSHELRTPLNAILGFSQMLIADTNKTLAPDDRDAVTQIFKGGEHLLGLVNEILDLAKIESGKLSVSIVEVSPADTLENCLISAKTLGKDHSIKIVDETAPDLPTLWVDEVRFQQVLLNLLSNAIKYNRDNGTVTVSSSLSADNMLRLTITDTGPGIPKDKQDRLFEPFIRLSPDDASREGTGIGLTITRRLVEAMNGRIGFETEVGKGTSFWIDFPIASQAATETDLLSN